MLKDVLEMLGKLLVWWLVAFGVFALFIMQCSKEAEASVTITDVIYAIEEVESNRNPYAINKQENALGCLQIRPIMIADYNRITGEDLAHDIAYNRSMAYIIASTIFNHYIKGIENPNAKHLAFIWNGGGSAWKRVDNPQKDRKQKMLDSYWEKVRLHL
jgi:soluble lytic murein transglycosylase-like protein